MNNGEIIYLDNNATTQLDSAVVEEMLPFLTKFYANPSSGYQFGAEARRAIDLARERVSVLLDCEASEIVFTSCGTESNNAAMSMLVTLSVTPICARSAWKIWAIVPYSGRVGAYTKSRLRLLTPAWLSSDLALFKSNA